MPGSPAVPSIEYVLPLPATPRRNKANPVAATPARGGGHGTARERTGLAVGEDRPIVSLQRFEHDSPRAALIHLRVAGGRAEDGVEMVRLARDVRVLHDRRVVELPLDALRPLLLPDLAGR